MLAVYTLQFLPPHRFLHTFLSPSSWVSRGYTPKSQKGSHVILTHSEKDLFGRSHYGRLFGAAASTAGAALKATALGTKVTRKSPNSSSRIPE